MSEFDDPVEQLRMIVAGYRSDLVLVGEESLAAALHFTDTTSDRPHELTLNDLICRKRGKNMFEYLRKLQESEDNPPETSENQ